MNFNFELSFTRCTVPEFSNIIGIIIVPVSVWERPISRHTLPWAESVRTGANTNAGERSRKFGVVQRCAAHRVRFERTFANLFLVQLHIVYEKWQWTIHWPAINI
jgi:hypothetical protein